MPGTEANVVAMTGTVNRDVCDPESRRVRDVFPVVGDGTGVAIARPLVRSAEASREGSASGNGHSKTRIR
jgi:hypothetical protein